MSQINTFPKNILAALDGLAELGKAVKNNNQHEAVIYSQKIKEKLKDRVFEKPLVKSDRGRKQAGK